jgi:hypothetical protein
LHNKEDLVVGYHRRRYNNNNNNNASKSSPFSPSGRDGRHSFLHDELRISSEVADLYCNSLIQNGYDVVASLQDATGLVELGVKKLPHNDESNVSSFLAV